MAWALPVRSQKTYLYMPIISMACLLWWITGIGVWVHFTTVLKDNALDTYEILGQSLDSGIAAKVGKVVDSLDATAVIYAVLAALNHAMGIWRGVILAEQDRTGIVDEEYANYAGWASLFLLIGWWAIMIWNMVLTLEFGAVAATAFVMKESITNMHYLQLLFPTNPEMPTLSGYCPTTCLNTAVTGVFVYFSVGTLPTPGQKLASLCICDPATIAAAAQSAVDAWNAVGGMLTGLMFMLVYGVAILAWLHRMRATMRAEQDIAERLHNQGEAGTGQDGKGGGYIPPPRPPSSGPSKRSDPPGGGGGGADARRSGQGQVGTRWEQLQSGGRGGVGGNGGRGGAGVRRPPPKQQDSDESSDA